MARFASHVIPASDDIPYKDDSAFKDPFGETPDDTTSNLDDDPFAPEADELESEPATDAASGDSSEDEAADPGFDDDPFGDF